LLPTLRQKLNWLFLNGYVKKFCRSVNIVVLNFQMIFIKQERNCNP
jgi:hypothetical protein